MREGCDENARKFEKVFNLLVRTDYLWQFLHRGSKSLLLFGKELKEFSVEVTFYFPTLFPSLTMADDKVYIDERCVIPNRPLQITQVTFIFSTEMVIFFYCYVIIASLFFYSKDCLVTQ